MPLPMPYQKSSALRPVGESTKLLQTEPVQQGERRPYSRRTIAVSCLALLVLLAVASTIFMGCDNPTSALMRGAKWNMDASLWKYYSRDEKEDPKQPSSSKVKAGWAPFVTKRCDWVVNVFTEQNAGMSYEALREKYTKQVEDSNIFYRATAKIFWLDFSQRYKNMSFGIGIKAQLDKSTWTWVTGDQHLSNFGAWRNRHGTVVYSVNDFDEAAIYDFHVDVIRAAVSICGHAHTNLLSKKHRYEALRAFTDTYVKTVLGYVGNEKALTYELTSKTAKGVLKKFLEAVESDNSHKEQLEKFTEVDSAVGRRFIKNDKTRLVTVSPGVEAKIRSAFASDKYGATMMKTGWHVPSWSDDYFTVLDVTARVGTGVGSYGVDRYYVLVKGEGGNDGKGAIIFDVKFEPTPAVAGVLNTDDTAWYNVMFRNEAARAVEGQRRLTSYVDPYTGWVHVDDEALVVRQRSPWKAAPDLDAITDPHDFIELMSQVAVATATAHVRGTVGKSPGQFKEVIASVLGDKSNAKNWGMAIARAAENYREQVELDYHCFKDYVELNFPPDE